MKYKYGIIPNNLMYSSLFDDYFSENYIKTHNIDKWIYWKFGHELDRYEIYKLGQREEFKMILPLKHNSVKIYYKKLEDLMHHLEYIKNTL